MQHSSFADRSQRRVRERFVEQLRAGRVPGVQAKQLRSVAGVQRQPTARHEVHTITLAVHAGRALAGFELELVHAGDQLDQARRRQPGKRRVQPQEIPLPKRAGLDPERLP